MFTFSSRIVSLARHSSFEVYTSPLCLAITFYFAEKKNKAIARQKIKLLCDNIEITNLSSTIVDKMIKNNKINDFEVGLEYYSAIDSKCKCIITEDIDDFYFADIEILNAKSFF